MLLMLMLVSFSSSCSVGRTGYELGHGDDESDDDDDDYDSPVVMCSWLDSQ